jgi:glutamine amidotransferase
MIAIIDYGMGNIHSVQKALEHFGASTIVTNQPEELAKAEKVVLPGVGAFDDAVLELQRQGLAQAIREHISKKKLFLGICLGMQLLFESSQEARKTRGLGILKGEIKRFAPKFGIKIPHMGWNELNIRKQDCPLLKDVTDKSYVYFCHSYYPAPASNEMVAASTDYGLGFASLIWEKNIYAVQFHPEKSQEVGLGMLKNFVELKN